MVGSRRPASFKIKKRRVRPMEPPTPGKAWSEKCFVRLLYLPPPAMEPMFLWSGRTNSKTVPV